MLFAKAAESNPPNTWLWMNWGESFQMQGKEDAAIAMYRKALAHPVTQAGYDKARQQAYQFLLPILEARNDYDGQETLYRSQAAEYGYGLCNGPAYAVFMLRHRGNAAAAIDIAHKTGNSQCPAYDVREILGVANYVLWSTSSDPDKQTSWNKARAYMPASARLFYQLAKSDSLANVARELVRANDAVDMPDNNRMNALAYALRERDVAAARRLLRLGARPQAPVGPEEMPVALLPVVLGDSDAVRMLRKAGVDYTKLRFRGMTALDHAKSVTDQKMIKALEQGESV